VPQRRLLAVALQPQLQVPRVCGVSHGERRVAIRELDCVVSEVCRLRQPSLLRESVARARRKASRVEGDRNGVQHAARLWQHGGAQNWR
jgi:hypothetical protein